MYLVLGSFSSCFFVVGSGVVPAETSRGFQLCWHFVLDREEGFAFGVRKVRDVVVAVVVVLYVGW